MYMYRKLNVVVGTRCPVSLREKAKGHRRLNLICLSAFFARPDPATQRKVH